jgi:hypothetical protein
LLDSVAKEAAPALAQKTRQAGAPITVGARRSWWGVLGWAATAAILVFAASLWKENAALRQDVSTLRSLFGQQTVELEQARNVASAITNPGGERFTLVAVKAPPQPQGKAFYLRNRSNLVFVANNMPALPPQKAYELWLIPAQGAPIPAGVFKPDAHGSATVVNPPLPAGAEAKAFAITVENEAGATAPTMPIIMMGTGE